MKALETEINLAASPAGVWDILVGLDRYHEWNPFIISASGRVAEGAQLDLTIALTSLRMVKVRATVTEVKAGQVLEWLSHVAAPGMLDSRHRFELRAIDPGTRLVQTEVFSGALVPPMSHLLHAGTRAGFLAMNEALQHRVEHCDGPKRGEWPAKRG